MNRVSLSRLPGDRALVVDGDLERAVALVDLPAYVRAREVDAPRWVWACATLRVGFPRPLRRL